MATPDKKQLKSENEPPPLPKRIRLLTPYGFYDDDKQPRIWSAGHVTDDPTEIELFVTRQVDFELLE